MEQKRKMVTNPHIRADKELTKIIRYIQMEHLKRNKKPPTHAQITRIIARKIKKEDMLYNDFIKI